MKYCKPKQFAILKVPCIFLIEQSFNYKVLHLVSHYCEISVDVLKSVLKTREVVEARQIAMVLIKNNSVITWQRLGKLFKRDHATVIYAIKTVSDLLITDKYFKSKFEFLDREVKAIINITK